MPHHAERRLLPYQPRQLFDLVADIERYPEFLPWCVGARIRHRLQGEKGPVLHADLIIGFKMIRERFTSRVTLDPEAGRIDVAFADGPFKYLRNHWVFEPTPQEGGRVATTIDFDVDFEFRSRLLETLIQPLFTEAVRRMVAAFESRARQLYGATPAVA